MKKIENIEDAKLMIEAWQTWSEALEIWLLDIAKKKRLTKATASSLQQLFDWDVLNKGVAWTELDSALKEV